jgi:protein-arginine kinase activator protein McsA
MKKIVRLTESDLVRIVKRVIKEQTEDLQDDMLQQIIDMDRELDNDPTYKRYEKVYTGNKLKRMIQDQMGMDLDSMSEEASEALIDMFSSMVEISKSSGQSKMTRDSIINNKDNVMDIVNKITQMAIEDDEYELASKLRDYNKLLQYYN